MGSSSKKHKKDRDSKKHKRHRSRSQEQRSVRDSTNDRTREYQKNRSLSKSPVPGGHSSNDFSARRLSNRSTRELDRDKRPYKKHKERNRSRSRSPHRSNEKSYKRGAESPVDAYDSDSSDCVEVPLPPPAPVISKRQSVDIPSVPAPPTITITTTTTTNSSSRSNRNENSSSSRQRDRRSPEIIRDYRDKLTEKRDHHRSNNQENNSNQSSKQQKRNLARTPSPIPTNGAGDCLSIDETNKLRAKLGLKPLEVDPVEVVSTEINKISNNTTNDKNVHGLNSYKDEWGEFLHKPANDITKKSKEDKMRDKLKESKERRALEERYRSVRGLGESDDEVDDLSKWVKRNKNMEKLREEAAKKAKMFEELDEELAVDNSVNQEKSNTKKQKSYNSANLKGLRVQHDYENFAEGESVILTLKDKDVLDENDDALINVNMVDDERYEQNNESKKTLRNFGYDVYDSVYDQFGDRIQKNVLSKYDKEIDKNATTKEFTIGSNAKLAEEHKQRLLQIKNKLSGKRLETLDDCVPKFATDTYSEKEMTQFKKPKKKIKKLRQNLKADDLVPLANTKSSSTTTDYGSRNKIRGNESPTFVDSESITDLPELKYDVDDDLQQYLSRARKQKQKAALGQQGPMRFDHRDIKPEIKTEYTENSLNNDDDMTGTKDNHIILNATAEFCRTLGDIPTYGMAGNRDEDSNDAMDFELDSYEQEKKVDENINSGGTWNSVNPNLQTGMDDEGVQLNEIADVAILDEEPDVGAGVAAALQLALSKGYLEKDDLNRPSNAKMSHLQAKNYTIDDKAYGEEDKQYSRRDRYHGPISEFHDKDNFKPNVKLDYIDDNGRILNAKEAFRYLSHKFHGKGPGKNKIEKRLKKMEQEGLMKTMSSTDTPLGTLTMLQQKQKDTQTPYVVLSGGKQIQINTTSTISKQK